MTDPVPLIETTPTQASMPMRHGGRLASRASTCPRDHFHDCTTFIVPHHVKRILADIDTDHGDCRIELVWHGVLLVFGAPFQLPLLAGPEHGRTIPLPDLGLADAMASLRAVAPGAQLDFAAHDHTIKLEIPRLAT